MLFLTAPARAQDTPPPPRPVWAPSGLVVFFDGGVLVQATGLRPLYPWPVVCEASPCRVQANPGDALAVVAADGAASPVVLVPPRPRLVALPWVRR